MSEGPDVTGQQNRNIRLAQVIALTGRHDPAGQPDQSQPRRRNSTAKRTPTMSITTSTAG